MVNPSYAELEGPLQGQDPTAGKNERIEAYLMKHNAEIDRRRRGQWKERGHRR